LESLRVLAITPSLFCVLQNDNFQVENSSNLDQDTMPTLTLNESQRSLVETTVVHTYGFSNRGFHGQFGFYQVREYTLLVLFILCNSTVIINRVAMSIDLDLPFVLMCNIIVLINTSCVPLSPDTQLAQL